MSLLWPNILRKNNRHRKSEKAKEENAIAKDCRGIEIEEGDKIVISNMFRRLEEKKVMKIEGLSNNFKMIRFEKGWITPDKVAVVEKASKSNFDV